MMVSARLVTVSAILISVVSMTARADDGEDAEPPEKNLHRKTAQKFQTDHRNQHPRKGCHLHYSSKTK